MFMLSKRDIRYQDMQVDFLDSMLYPVVTYKDYQGLQANPGKISLNKNGTAMVWRDEAVYWIRLTDNNGEYVELINAKEVHIPWVHKKFTASVND